MESEFELHPQLAKDTFILADLTLSRLLLMNDAQYPWCILVPRTNGVREIHDLCESDQAQLLRESVGLGRAMMSAFDGDKLNVAALGNVVPQLHVHHIVRFRMDPTWPAPVWGRHPAQPYDRRGRQDFVERLTPYLVGVRLNP
ncbi:MAG: HIT domain-containing protein [Panacagrimonas sp.]